MCSRSERHILAAMLMATRILNNETKATGVIFWVWRLVIVLLLDKRICREEGWKVRVCGRQGYSFDKIGCSTFVMLLRFILDARNTSSRHNYEIQLRSQRTSGAKSFRPLLLRGSKNP